MRKGILRVGAREGKKRGSKRDWTVRSQLRKEGRVNTDRRGQK